MTDDQDYVVLLQRSADLPPPDSIQPEKLENAAREVVRMQGVLPPAMLSIIVGTDETIRDMNQRYRGIDAPTDILSFPADPLPPEVAQQEEAPYLGDIIIGLPYAARRARQEGRSIHDELVLLVVHGTLHLLGFDHDTPENQKTMWALQAKALQALNVNMDVPDYIHEDPTKRARICRLDISDTDA